MEKLGIPNSEVINRTFSNECGKNVNDNRVRKDMVLKAHVLHETTFRCYLTRLERMQTFPKDISF